MGHSSTGNVRWFEIQLPTNKDCVSIHTTNEYVKMGLEFKQCMMSL